MKDIKVGFVGAGNMGGIIARAITSVISADNVFVRCSSDESTQKAAQKIGCKDATMKEACNVDYLFLGIKPQLAQTVIPEVSSVISESGFSGVLVSMLAGVTIEKLKEISHYDRVIRIMPNTPAALGSGVTLVCASSAVDEETLKCFLELISPLGKSDIIPEKLFDAATALSGCGPAYVYMFLEALADGAVKCGLPRAQAEEYAARTVLGAAKMALNSDKHTGELKDEVCSPGGSTIEGVFKLENDGFRSSVMGAVCAAYEKSKMLGK